MPWALRKQPPVKVMPFMVLVPPETVRLLPMLRFVVVALVPVALMNVRSFVKRLPSTLMLVVVALVPVAEVKARVPMVLLVEANVVEVAWVEKSDWRVVEERVMRLVKEAKLPASWVVMLRLVPVALVQLRPVKRARVEKRSVEVASVVVARPMERY